MAYSESELDHQNTAQGLLNSCLLLKKKQSRALSVLHAIYIDQQPRHNVTHKTPIIIVIILDDLWHLNELTWI